MSTQTRSAADTTAPISSGDPVYLVSQGLFGTVGKIDSEADVASVLISEPTLSSRRIRVPRSNVVAADRAPKQPTDADIANLRLQRYEGSI
jgi:hypothetical protein